MLKDAHVQALRQRVTTLPDLRMSKHSRVLCAIAIVEDQPDWDFALDSEKSFDAVIKAASFYGYNAPFTPEQKVLRDFLVKNIAGRKIAMYAWGVYADISGNVRGDIMELG